MAENLLQQKGDISRGCFTQGITHEHEHEPEHEHERDDGIDSDDDDEFNSAPADDACDDAYM